jgi:dTDP-glucose 4,6-dehydratase
VKVLVTGGAGFIGSNFVRRVVDGTLSGISEITVFDKLTYAGTLTNLSKLPKDSFRFVEGDICDRDLTETLVAEHDAVINFAAESHVDRSILGSKDFVLTNVLGTQTLLDAARNTSLEIFLQVSTDEVYGSILQGSWSEFEPLMPNSPYAATKASADLMVRSYQRTYSLDARITRCSNNYGPHQFPEKIIPLFVTNLMDQLKVPVYGDGSNSRDWLHVDDHCFGIHAVLMKGKAGEIYNIGGGTEIPNIELTRKILGLMGRDDSHIEYVKDRLGHDQRYSVDISKIVNELGYAPTIKLDDGLQETIAWYESNELWWRALK